MKYGLLTYEEFLRSKDEIEIKSVSYVGNPTSHTAMFVGNKVDYLIDNLRTVNDCLVFTQKGARISEELLNKHLFVICDNPSFDYAYALFLNEITSTQVSNNKYTQMENGVFIGENVQIGKNANIEPGCLIGPDVRIGDNAYICSQTVIKHSVIGDNFISREGAKIGTEGFGLAKDENGNLYRIPFMGNVIIGNNVEVGVNSNISRSLAGSTVVENFTKIDSLVYVGHDTKVGSNVKIMAGVIAPGFIEINDAVQIAINASIRNRIVIEKGAYIGMGATVVQSVDSGIVVVGNPAKELKKG